MKTINLWIVFLIIVMFGCTKTETPEPEQEPQVSKLITMSVELEDLGGQMIFVDCMGIVDTIGDYWQKLVVVNDGATAILKVYSDHRRYGKAKMEVAGRTVANGESNDLYDNPINLFYSW